VLLRTGPELAALTAALALVPLGAASVLNAVVPGAAYVAGVEHIRRAGRAWPARRTAALLAALLVLGAATSGAADARAQASLAWHMTQQMALLFVVPLGIVAARPDELAGRRSRWAPSAAALGAAWLAVAVVQWLVHAPAVLDALARRPAALAAVHWALVAAGVGFFGCALAAVASRRFHPLAVVLYVVSVMAATDAIGLWLLFDPHVVYDRYAGAGALADQERAGAVMFAAGMVPLLVGAGIALRWLSPDAASRPPKPDADGRFVHVE
jgi:cytochrome c oxidase assembly factor CtaG